MTDITDEMMWFLFIKYVTMKANPASILNDGNVDRLRFLTGPELPQ